jgi:hypothetical protein
VGFEPAAARSRSGSPSLGKHAAAWVLAMGSCLVGCGGPETEGEHAVLEADDGLVIESHWSYQSFDVDVDLWLATNLRPSECFTTATLRVNSVLSAADRYGLEPTECSTLELTQDGDIVLYEQPTGHRWADEALSVDTDDELIGLGPATVADPVSGEPVRVLFTLSAPPCSDDRDCSCGVLRRLSNAETLELPLGRTCD